MGQLLVFPCQRSGLFYLLLFAAEQAAIARTMGLPCSGGDDRRFLGAFHLYLAAPFFMFLRPGPLIERFSWQPLRSYEHRPLLAAAALLGVGLGAI